MRLAKEGSRRKLGRFSSFGCDGFEFHGKKLAESAGDSELAHSPFMATREGEGEESEVQTGVRQVASSGKLRERLGDATDGRATRRRPRRPRTASGGVVAITAHCGAQGENREKRMAYDRWGPRVRFEFS